MIYVNSIAPRSTRIVKIRLFYFFFLLLLSQQLRNNPWYFEKAFFLSASLRVRTPSIFAWVLERKKLRDKRIASNVIMIGNHFH